MKLYINTRKMTFNEDTIEHDIILSVYQKKGELDALEIDIDKNDKFIKDTLKTIYKQDKKGKDTKEIERKIFIVKEQKTWHSFPLYEIIDGKIIDFDYTRYSYFSGTDRRVGLAQRINGVFNPPSEAKVMRKTLKYIMDTLDIDYPDFFQKYNDKIEGIINKNPKN